MAFMCPFNGEECPIPQRERTDTICVACRISELSCEVREVKTQLKKLRGELAVMP